MKLQLTIDSSNTALVNGQPHELARIVADVAQRISESDTSGQCIDYNGNAVGTWELQP